MRTSFLLIGLSCLGACAQTPIAQPLPITPVASPPVIDPPGTPSRVVAKSPSYDEALIAALHHFVATGEVGYATALLKKHPELVGQCCPRPGLRRPRYDDHYTALHIAAREGDAEMVQLLLDFGGKVNADGGEGWTPVHVAAKHNHVEVLKVLDRAGADLKAQTLAIPPQPLMGMITPAWGPGTPAMSALDIAKQFRSEAAIKYLEGQKP